MENLSTGLRPIHVNIDFPNIPNDAHEVEHCMQCFMLVAQKVSTKVVHHFLFQTLVWQFVDSAESNTSVYQTSHQQFVKHHNL